MPNLSTTHITTQWALWTNNTTLSSDKCKLRTTLQRLSSTNILEMIRILQPRLRAFTNTFSTYLDNSLNHISGPPQNQAFVIGRHWTSAVIGIEPNCHLKFKLSAALAEIDVLVQLRKEENAASSQERMLTTLSLYPANLKGLPVVPNA